MTNSRIHPPTEEDISDLSENLEISLQNQDNIDIEVWKFMKKISEINLFEKPSGDQVSQIVLSARSLINRKARNSRRDQ